jgi:5-methylcytosine-specific restriction endonuclease McrA
MTKTERHTLYSKYGGRCAYCGRAIEYKDMQVDHIIPRRQYSDSKAADRPVNLNPSCRRCNHYKRAHNLEMFRLMLKTLHNRVWDIYICKVAEDYGIIKIESWDGKFYFEKGEG